MTEANLLYHFKECVRRNACETYDEVMEALIEMDELADITESDEDYLEQLTTIHFPQS